MAHLIVPDEDVAVVERAEHPGLGGVYIHRLDAVGPRGEFLLDFQTERLLQISVHALVKNNKHFRAKNEFFCLVQRAKIVNSK